MAQKRQNRRTLKSSRRSSPSSRDPLAPDYLALEQDRLQLEKRRLALEIWLKRKELSRKSWSKETFSNPVTIAIVGGVLTLMTQIVSSALNVAAQRDADIRQAESERAAGDRQLQADLIKKFAEAPDLVTARGNLEFLVGAGLLPDYEPGIAAYLKENPASGPRVGRGDSATNISCRNVPVSASFPESLSASLTAVGDECQIDIAGGGSTQVRCSGFKGVLTAPPSVTVALVESERECKFFVN